MSHEPDQPAPRAELDDLHLEAVRKIYEGLQDGGRGQFRTLTGFGTDRVLRRTIAQLCSEGLVVVLGHQKAFVHFHLRQWVDAAMDPAANILGWAAGKDDPPVSLTEGSAAIANWLDTDSAGRRLLVGTYSAAHTIGAGLLQANAAAEFLVVEQAEILADRRYAHADFPHDDAQLPAKRRLYVTRSRGPASADEQAFGPVLVDYSFSKLLANGVFDSFKPITFVTPP